MYCRMDIVDMIEYVEQIRVGYSGQKVYPSYHTFDGDKPVVTYPIGRFPYVRPSGTQCEGICARLAYRIRLGRYPDTLADLEYRRALGMGLLDITVMLGTGRP